MANDFVKLNNFRSIKSVDSVLNYPVVDHGLVTILKRYVKHIFNFVFPPGKVLSARSRQVPNFAVVPVFGCPVNRTVNDIVTNAWLVVDL